MKENLIVMTCINKTVTEDLICRYQKSTKDAVEGILSMGEAVFEIYTKSKSGELSKRDLEYFCDSVGLDSKQSTFRKYKAIGENANRFREVMEKLPSTFSVLYEMATLSGDEFEQYVVKRGYSKNLTLDEFKKIVNKSSVLAKNKMINPPSQKISTRGISKLIKEKNRFSIDIACDLPESKFNDLVDLLTEYRNKGWLRFEYPVLTEYVNEDDDLVIDELVELVA